MSERIFKTFGFLILSCILLAAQQSVAAQGYSVKTIVIDAGHGGKDPGALGKYSKEKDITLKVALLTGKYIEEYLNDVEVVYTRKTDVFIPLPERATIAQNKKADLFVSIHVDAIGKNNIVGASTYVLGQHRSEDNLRVAQKENSVITLEDNYEEKYSGFDPNRPESYIIFNFVTSAYLEQSTQLADLIQGQFKNRVGRHDRGVHQAGFLVLRETSMPSVLVELGFITNSTEEKYLNTTEGQEYMASALFRAIRDYKTQIEGRNHINVTQAEQVSATPETTVEVAPIQIPEAATSTPAEQQKDELTFKLQVLASVKPIDVNGHNFEGLPDVEFYREGNYYKYTIGNTDDVEDIKAIKEAIKKRFPDAFIVVFKNGEKVPMSQASQLIN